MPTHRPTFALLAIAGLALAAAPASAQFRLLLADRDSDAIRILIDRNNNGVIDEPDELGIFFNGLNAEGTPAPLNPTSIGVTRGGTVLVGDLDAAARHWLVLEDIDRNGNAQSEDESNIGAGPGNVEGASFAAPSGFAQSPDERIFLVNAGNGFGPDQIWIAIDLNDDNDAMDDDEIIAYVTINGFGGNGPFSPQEIAFGGDGALYLRNSGNAGNHIYRLNDNDLSGFIDDPAEFTTWFGAGNAENTPVSAGLALEIDPTRPRSFYTLQTASGGVDQLVRATDLDSDGNAQGDDESAVVWSTDEDGLAASDILALPDGRVFVSDNSGNRIIILFDVTADGDFLDTGERSTFLVNASGTVTSARGMAFVPCPSDFNSDLQINPDDLSDFITCFFLDISFPGTCEGADHNHDGFLNPDDLTDFITAFFLPC
jgi:hypothetical protein